MSYNHEAAFAEVQTYVEGLKDKFGPKMTQAIGMAAKSKALLAQARAQGAPEQELKEMSGKSSEILGFMTIAYNLDHYVVMGEADKLIDFTAKATKNHE